MTTSTLKRNKNVFLYNFYRYVWQFFMRKTTGNIVMNCELFNHPQMTNVYTYVIVLESTSNQLTIVSVKKL